MNITSNAADYQFLIRTLLQGTSVTRSQSLRRLSNLAISDKKQFSTYAKRIVIAMQDLLLEPSDDNNLLTCTLALEIINLNPRDIEFYIRTKLLKNMVINLGDLKPQVRKNSHYCLLAFVKTYKNFDDLIQIYIANGINSSEWQLRQKAINSFQSILVMEMRYLNWSSPEFKKIFQLLLLKLKDESNYVQKAAEQCLLSLVKIDEIKNFVKKLSNSSFILIKNFCQAQFDMGNLQEIKFQISDKNHHVVERSEQNQNHKKASFSERYEETTSRAQNNISLNFLEKTDKIKIQTKKSIISESYQQNRKKMQTPKIEQRDRHSLRKVESSIGVNQVKQLQNAYPLKINKSQREQLSIKKDASIIFPPIINLPTKPDKIENMLGKKILEDIKNDKDWKTRLEAVQQLQTKFQIYREEIDIDILIKTFLPLLIKLLGDQNFKIALIALKIIQEMLRLPQLSLELIVPQIIDKLSDNKVALRQNISKLIKSQYSLTKAHIWVDNLLLQIKKSSNSNLKEQILNILTKLYEEGNIPFPFEKVLEVVCPLMDDLKTKIKIKTLDLLANITIKSQKIDRAKNVLASKMNQVYYQMFLEKIAKELKSMKPLPFPEEQKTMRSSLNSIQRKTNKVGNSTSTSLQKCYIQESQNNTVKTAFYQSSLSANQMQISDRVDTQQDSNHLTNQQLILNTKSANQTDDQAPRKKYQAARYLKRRDQKSIQSRLLSTNNSNDQGFPPFSDPVKELKNINNDLKSDDWQISVEALNKLRRIIANHSELLNSAALKLIIPDLMKMSESLRSSLSKNAVITLNQLSTKLKRQLDPEFDNIFSKLIKRTLDTNSFISEQVRKALISICSNCNQAKVVNILTNVHSTRAIPIKTAIVTILETITFIPRFFDKQLERIVMILVNFMSEGSLQIRQKTKQILNSLINSDQGHNILKLIPNEHKSKLIKKQIPIQLSPAKSQEQIIPKNNELQQQIQISPRKKKKNKLINFPQEFESFDNLLQQCQSSDWRTRLENMTSISIIALNYPEELLQHRCGSKIVDVLSKQINDPNAKVAVNALKIFIQITLKIPLLIQNSLSVILNEVFNCFSAKPEIRQLAEELFDSICKHIQKWMLTQHLCNGALYSLPKSKPLILQKLTQLLPSIHKLKPNIFQKNVYPMINKLAEQNKQQISPSLKELIQTVYTQIGQQCMGFLKQKAKQLVFQ